MNVIMRRAEDMRVHTRARPCMPCVKSMKSMHALREVLKWHVLVEEN